MRIDRSVTHYVAFLFVGIGGKQMELQGISKTELRDMIKEAMICVLSERKDLLEEAVSEAILDMKLGLAIEEGDTGEYVPESEVLSKLAG